MATKNTTTAKARKPKATAALAPMQSGPTVAIIHFNTPELTEACILSIRKHGCDWPVVVFDNSADITAPACTNGNDPKEDTIIKARPFRQKMKGV